MENTFKKEITFLGRAFNTDSNTWQPGDVTKTITFEELDRSNAKQHKLHFMLVSLIKGVSGDVVKVDTDALHDLTIKFIECATVVNEEFTEQDKQELIADSFGLLQLGLWLSKEKFTPFFVLLMRPSKK